MTDKLKDQQIDVPSYSWVHLNDFRLFELHGRCYPWTTVDELLWSNGRTSRVSQTELGTTVEE